MIILRQKFFSGETQEYLKRQAAAGKSPVQQVAKGQMGTSKVALQTRSKEQLTKSAQTFDNLSKSGNALKTNAALGTNTASVKQNVNNMMNNQRLTNSNQNFRNGLNSATINKTTIANTWNSMGTAGKVGTAAVALGATALAAKGVKSLFDKKKKED